MRRQTPPNPRRGRARLITSLAGVAMAGFAAAAVMGLAPSPMSGIAHASVTAPNTPYCDFADPLPGCDKMTYSPPQYTVTGRDPDPDAAQAEAEQLALETCNGPYHTVKARPGTASNGAATFTLTFTCS